jgi:hypothetical protein
MNQIVRAIVQLVVALMILFSAVVAEAGSRSHLLNEDAALDLLARTLKHDNVYDGVHRISLDCVFYMTEEMTDNYFGFVLREKHDAKCGGIPETAPVVDRYRVYRRSGKIQQYEAASDTWHPYKPAKNK